MIEDRDRYLKKRKLDDDNALWVESQLSISRKEEKKNQKTKIKRNQKSKRATTSFSHHRINLRTQKNSSPHVPKNVKLTKP